MPKKKKNNKKKKGNKLNFQLIAVIFLLTMLIVGCVFFLPGNIKNFVLAFTEKSSGDPIYESDWNNLDNDFVATTGSGISGNLGIGMSGQSSIAKIEVDMESLTTTEGLHISRDAAGYAYLNIEDESANPIFKVHESGKVGIGTATPAGQLDVAGSICFSGDCRSDWETTGGLWSTGTGGIYYSAGNVGIGTTNSEAKLEVYGGNLKINSGIETGSDSPTTGVLKFDNMYDQAGNRTANKIVLYDNGNDWKGGIGISYSYVDFFSGEKFGFWVAHESEASPGTEAMTILYNGNVGIGTTNPEAKLSVNGMMHVNTISADSGLTVGEVHSATAKELVLGYDTTNNYANIQSIWQGNEYTPLILQKDGGNVGIGTTTPAQKLEVAGLMAWHGSGTERIGFLGGDDGTTKIIASHNHLQFEIDRTTDDFIWVQEDASVELMRLTGEGNVGIGTTGPSAKLTVNMADLTTTEGFRISRSAAASHYAYLNIEDESANPIFKVHESGNVGIGTTAPGEKLEVSGNIKLSGTSPAYKITNMVLPTASSDAATKGYVDAAQGGANKSSSLGADMLTSYFDGQGLFTPHSNTCDGTESFVALFSGASVGFCIEKNERSAQHWEDARKTCAANGKRLPEPGEWKDACQNAGALGLSAMVDNWEWASNFSLPVYDGSGYGVGSAVFGDGGCGFASWAWVGGNAGAEGSNGFRCVR